MTLREWSQQTGIVPTHPTTEKNAVSVLANESTPQFHDLWHLSDFRVATRRGSVVLLMPLPQTAEVAPTRTIVLVQLEDGLFKDTNIIGPANAEVVALDWDQIETDESMAREAHDSVSEAYDAMYWHPDRNHLFLAKSRLESIIADNFDAEICPTCGSDADDRCPDCDQCEDCCDCNDDPLGEDAEDRGDTEPEPEP